MSSSAMSTLPFSREEEEIASPFQISAVDLQDRKQVCDASSGPHWTFENGVHAGKAQDISGTMRC